MSQINASNTVETANTETDDQDDAERSFPVDMVQVNISVKTTAEAQSLLDTLGITASMERVSAEAEKRLDDARKAQAKKMGMDPVRADRGDTGKPVFGKNGETNVDASTIVAVLVASGLRATAAQHINKPTWKNGKLDESTRKHVVRLTFEAGEDSVEIAGLADKLTAFLKGKGSVFCHVWQNDFSDTINLVGGFTDKPKKTLGFADETYVVSPVR